MERVGTHKYMYVLVYIKEPTELVFSRLTLTLLHFFLRHLSGLPFQQSSMAGCSIPLTLVVAQNPLPQVRVGGQRLLYNKPEPSLKTDSQCCDHAPAINSAIKEAEGRLDPFLLFPPLRYYMLCALTHPLPQKVGCLGENRTEVLERQKRALKSLFFGVIFYLFSTGN